MTEAHVHNVSTAAMAFILVFSLHKMKAYSFMQWQIVLLHVQSKPAASMAALQPVHGWRHSFFMIFRLFRDPWPDRVAFVRQGVEFCACKVAVGWRLARRKTLADVPFSC